MVAKFQLIVRLGIHSILGISLISSAWSATPKRTLTLNDYLNAVKAENSGIKGSSTAAQAGQMRSKEGELLLAPTIFASAKLTSDAKIQPTTFFQFDNYLLNTYSLGVSQLTQFGLLAKLHYDMITQVYNNASIPGIPLAIPFSYANASPVLELTQNLWSNGLGRSTRATQQQLEADALATSYNESYLAKSNLSAAEASYWRLASARQTLAIQSEALDRANQIYGWQTRRARLHLGDDSDVLQAEALLKTRELDLLAGQNEERSASRSFNSFRNIDSDQVSERLVELNSKSLESMQVPRRVALRDDVKAAQQATRSSEALTQISLERDLPTLDLTASVALSGQQGYSASTTLSQSLPLSFSLNRPTFTVGLNFNFPINFELTSRTSEGWRLQRIAADLIYDRKLFEQEESWKDLVESLREAKQRLFLAERIEFVQESKLKNEKDRLKRGRTTTYQVLLFEQDYLQAQLVRVQNQVRILNLIAQMKIFGETYESS